MSGVDYQKVVVAFDFSDHSRFAIRFAEKIASKRQSIHIVHVLPPLNANEPGVIWGTVDDESRIKHARQAMLDEKLNVPEENLHILVGDAGRAVAKLADDIEAELVVVGSHGRTGFQHMLLGSVAERITRYCQPSVLLVKPPRESSD